MSSQIAKSKSTTPIAIFLNIIIPLVTYFGFSIPLKPVVAGLFICDFILIMIYVRHAHEGDGFNFFVGRGMGSILERPFIAFGAIIALAMLDASILRGVFNFFDINDFEALQAQGAMGKNSAMIRVILSYTGLNILKILLLGPLFAATAVYLGRAYASNTPASFYGAINFSISKYGRLFVPFLIAQLSIQLGMIIVIPGVLFMMQYAFVDSIACLEKEEAIITRSRKMTRGLRGTMLGFILPWAIFSQVMGLITVQYSGNFITLTSVNFILEFCFFLVLSCFFMVYEYRTSQLIARRAKREEKAVPPRTVVQHKDSSGFGILVMLGCLAFIGTVVYTSDTKQNYGSCVYGTVQTALQNAQASKTRVDTLKVCEKAKGICTTEKSAPPCSVTCSDRGLPDTSQCN